MELNADLVVYNKSMPLKHAKPPEITLQYAFRMMYSCFGQIDIFYESSIVSSGLINKVHSL